MNQIKLFYRHIVWIIIDHVALAKQGDNALGSIHPFVCLFACPLLFVASLQVQGVRPYVCNQWAYADDRADVVDRLLI